MKPITDNLRLGVMELFAVLMPGAALCIVLGQWPALKETFLQMLPDRTSEWQGGVAFLISAYFIGYVAYAIGSRMDKIVDEYWINPNKTDLVYRVIPLKVREIGFDDPESLNNYQWALARLMMEQPELYAEVERYQATAKFFRSMAVVAFVAITVFLLQGKINLMFGAAGFLGLSLYLYYDRRRKSLEIVYKRIITVLGAPSDYPVNVEGLEGLNIRIGVAEQKKDYAFLNAVLADNLVFRRANEKVVTDKKAYLNALADVEYLSIVSSVENITLSADERSAYVVVIVEAETKQGAKPPVKGTYRNERLFHLNKDGNWTLVGWVNGKMLEETGEFA